MYKKTVIDVFENWRYWDKEGNEHFLTEEICDVCREPSMAYLALAIQIYPKTPMIPVRICKTCLTRGIEKIDEAIIKNCKKAERK